MMLQQISKEDVVGEVAKQWLQSWEPDTSFNFITDLLCDLEQALSHSWPVLSPIIWRKNSKMLSKCPSCVSSGWGPRSSSHCPRTPPAAIPLCFQSQKGDERMSLSHVFFPFKLRFTKWRVHISLEVTAGRYRVPKVLCPDLTWEIKGKAISRLLWADTAAIRWCFCYLQK